MLTERNIRTRYVAVDFVATSLAWLLFNITRFALMGFNGVWAKASLSTYLLSTPVMAGQLLFPVMMLGIYYLSGFYNSVFFKSRIEEFMTTLGSTLLGCVTIYFIAIFNDPIPDRASNYELVLTLWGLMFGLVWAGRLTITELTRRQMKSDRWHFPVLVVGVNREAAELYRRLHDDRRGSGYTFVGFVDDRHNTADGAAAIADEITATGLPVYRFGEVGDICARDGVKALIIAPSDRTNEETLRLLNPLFSLAIPIYISPTLFHLLTGKQKLRDIAGEPLVDISSPSMSQSTINLKRTGDAVTAALALVVLAPLMGVIALAVKLTSRGPVLYRQERIGYHKKPFNILKFRTMRVDAEKNGPALSSADDKRITRVGHILRKYRLDELPQFWNVLIGEMSIVGPRPEREYYIRRILERAPYYTLIHQVRPGITSWGMVRHGYASSVDEMIERVQYDLIYIANISLLVDMKILFYTVSTVVNGRGM